MESDPIITLTTDFGSKDPFVGIMKGVILTINPAANIIDITHEISPQNILEASYAIQASYAYFPHRTIHIVVVDPGVGSSRRPLLISVGQYYFIGPDNGIFSRIYEAEENAEVIHVNATHYFLSQESTTFHGRDIFAPVGAWLSKGITIEKFGDHVEDYVSIPKPVPVIQSDKSIEGEVVYIDRFGNLITNIAEQAIKNLIESSPDKAIQVTVKNMEIPMKNYYAESSDEGLYAIINSFAHLELFVNKGNASTKYNIAVGDNVGVHVI
jgi:S-adenosylmethionine hydrolase